MIRQALKIIEAKDKYTLTVTKDYNKLEKVLPTLPKGVDFEEFESKAVFFSTDKKALEGIKSKIKKAGLDSNLTIEGEI